MIYFKYTKNLIKKDVYIIGANTSFKFLRNISSARRQIFKCFAEIGSNLSLLKKKILQKRLTFKRETRCSPSKFDGKYFNFVWFLVCEFRHDSI